MNNKDNLFFPVEPLKENRFLINLHGTNIPSFLFREYKLYNEGEQMIFETEFYETVNYSFNPKDIFNITSVTLSYLDPVGEEVGGLYFMVSGSNLFRKQSYSNDDLQITNLRFVADVDTMKLLYGPTNNEESDKKND